MDEQEFWSIVDYTHLQSAGDVETQIGLLRERLDPLSSDDLLRFDAQLTRASQDVYDWQMWGAAYVLLGGCSDDNFTDFRTWLIFRGRERYEAVRRDPDALADIAVKDDEEIGLAEELGAVADDVYERKTGRELFEDAPQRPETLGELTGEPFDDDEHALAARYPRLTARVAASQDVDHVDAEPQVGVTRRSWRRLFGR